MKPLRVMVVGPYPKAGVARGGVDSAVAALTAGLAGLEAIDEVLVLSMEDASSHTVETPLPRVQVVRLRAQRLAMVSGGYRDLRAARQIASSFGPDIVHGHGVARWGDVATRVGAPCVITIHGMAHLEERALVSGRPTAAVRVLLMERMVERVIDRADGLISISDYDRAQLLLPDSTPGITLPNPVADEFFTVMSPPNPEPVVLCSGGLMPRKNQLELVAAFEEVLERLPVARLRLAGGFVDTDYAAMVRRAAERTGGRVVLTGPLDRREIVEELRGCRCLVLNSLQETLPCAIAEAMAAGRPVVATSVGGVPEMVRSGSTGLVVVPGDRAALTEAMMECLSRPGLAERLGAHARVEATRYQTQQIAADTVGFYHTVLRSSRSHPR